jgi:hypothetical protein
MKTGLLTIKLMTLAAMLAGLQFFVADVSGYKDTPGTVQLVDTYIRDGVNVLYFGDSTLYRGDPAEGPQPTLPELLQERMPNMKVGGVYHDAYNPELFLHFVRYLARRDHAVDTIVIPVNLRAFSPERLYRPEYQFVREKVFLSNDSKVFRAFYRPLAVFRAFDLAPINEKIYRDIVAYDGAEAIGALGAIGDGFVEDGPVDHIRASYFYPLDEHHAQIRALLEIAALCEANEIRLVLYATPIDTATGERFLPGRFELEVRNRVDIVRQALSDTDAIFLDLATALSPDRFAGHDYPDVYLNAAGKTEVADRLSEAIALPTP